MSISQLNFELSGREGRIVFAPLEEAAHFLEAELAGRRYLAVTDGNVGEHYGELISGFLAAVNPDFAEYVLPPGEASKTPENAFDLCRFAARLNFDRRSRFVAVGGGVTGDLTGFAASVYMRGVPVVHIPTTLLAMVDSSVGGKTAVDIPEGKNLIGTFHQPVLVLIDTHFLATLPPRELAGGLAEVVKYGVISDGAFFDLLEANVEDLLARDWDFYAEIVRRSCQFKLDIVKADECETLGIRALLNFGHSFGHAYEKLTHYTLNHGEAVAVGMVLAADFAVLEGRFAAANAARLRELLLRLGLPVKPPPGFTPEEVVKAMRNDKKNTGGTFHLVLPSAFGRAELVGGCAVETILEVLERNPA